MQSNSKLVVTSAVVLCPPHGLWPPIQSMRETQDRGFRRWMPHITLLYPFVSDQKFTPTVLNGLAKAAASVEPFEIVCDGFDFFEHGKKSFTLWLDPKVASPASINSLHKALTHAFPACREKRAFTAHMTVGQFKKKQELLKYRESHADIRLDWECRWLYVISRDGDEPFQFRHAVELGSGRVCSSGNECGFSIVPVQPSYQVFVGNIHPKCRSDDLEQLLSDEGIEFIRATVVMKDKRTSKGFGFIKCRSEKELNDCLSRRLQLNGWDLKLQKKK